MKKNSYIFQKTEADGTMRFLIVSLPKKKAKRILKNAGSSKITYPMTKSLKRAIMKKLRFPLPEDGRNTISVRLLMRTSTTMPNKKNILPTATKRL